MDDEKAEELEIAKSFVNTLIEHHYSVGSDPAVYVDFSTACASLLLEKIKPNAITTTNSQNIDNVTSIFRSNNEEIK